MVLCQNSSVSTRGQWEEMQDSVWLIFCAAKAKKHSPVCLSRYFSIGALKVIVSEQTKRTLFFARKKEAAIITLQQRQHEHSYVSAER